MSSGHEPLIRRGVCTPLLHPAGPLLTVAVPPEAQAFSTSVVSGFLAYFWSPVLLAFYLWNRRLIRDPLRFTRVFPSRRLVGSALKLRSSIHFKLISVYTEMASPTPWK